MDVAGSDGSAGDPTAMAVSESSGEAAATIAVPKPAASEVDGASSRSESGTGVALNASSTGASAAGKARIITPEQRVHNALRAVLRVSEKAF